MTRFIKRAGDERVSCQVNIRVKAVKVGAVLSALNEQKAIAIQI